MAVMVVVLAERYDLMRRRLGGSQVDRVGVFESSVQLSEPHRGCLILMDQPPPMKLEPVSATVFFEVAGLTLEEGEELEQAGWDENASSHGWAEVLARQYGLQHGPSNLTGAVDERLAGSVGHQM